MLQLILLAVHLWSAPVSKGPILLTEALDQGLLTVEAQSLGGHTGKVVELKMEPLNKKKFSVKIPAGLIMHTQDTTEQDLILVQERVLAFEGKRRVVRLNGYCVQASNRSPSAGGVLQVGSLASGHLLALASHLQEQRIEDSRGQEAVWVLSDEHPLSYVTDPELQQYLANLLGKEAPGFWIRHAGQGREGQPAFQHAPALIEGVFEFRTDTPREGRLGLYDEAGTLLKLLHDHGTLRAGNHRLRFTVELQNLEPGTYRVELRDAADLMLEGMDVQF